MIKAFEITGIVLEKILKEYGEDFKLDGEEIICVFNNCAVRVACDEDKKICISVTPDVIRIDDSVDIYEEE